MPFLTAERIHDGYKWLPENSVIEIAESGEIIALHKNFTGEAIFHDGVLVPGLVNTHCHLELSHLKGVIPKNTGLIDFLKSVPKYRNDFSDEEKRDARYAALNKMCSNGVVAVGDIANTNDSQDLRASNKMHFYSFVECIGFIESKADKAFSNSLPVFQQFANQTQVDKILRQAIVPHAPYSVSGKLFQMIGGYEGSEVLSIHNQECKDENEYYFRKDGRIKGLLHGLGVDDGYFVPSGKSSLQTFAKWLIPQKPVIFVHNTYTNQHDLEFALNYFKQSFWCFCPNANIYIEDKLPNIPMFQSFGATICIGTDSLASNDELSVLSELCAIKTNFPQVSWAELLKWATINGAKALQMESKIGSFEHGKKPGVLQIIGLDDLALEPQIKLISNY